MEKSLSWYALQSVFFVISYNTVFAIRCKDLDMILFPISMRLECQRNFYNSDSLHCYTYNRNYYLEILERSSRGNGIVKFCVGVRFFKDNSKLYYQDITKQYNLSFNSSVVIGAIEILPNASIIYEINVRQDIVNSNLFKYIDPYDSSFWNFTSDIWKADWLHSLSTGGYSFAWNNLYALNNTSVDSLEFIFQNSTEPATKNTGLIKAHMPSDLLLLPNLKKLTIQNGSLSEADLWNFSGYNCVQELKLSANQLTGIPENVVDLKNLTFFDFSSNRYIEWERFTQTLSKLTNLRKLIISSTPIDTVSLPLSGVVQLFELNMSNCSLINVIHDAFAYLPALEVLDISHNKLEQILLDLPEKLRILLLQNNNILTIEISSLTYLNITFLDLSFNVLSTWPILPKASINTLDLSSNFLTDCTQYELTDVLVLNVSQNSINNWSSNTMLSWVKEELNISWNDISVITENMKMSLLKIPTVDLADNPFDCSDCRIHNFQALSTNLRREVTCDSPKNQQGHRVQEAVCVEPASSVDIGVSIGTVAAFCLLLSAGGYRYRSELVYMFHLYKLRYGSKKEKPGALYDAFICYGAPDRRFVLRQLAPSLELSSARYRLCLHDRDFVLGSHITRNIVHSIDRSRHTIVVLSQHFIRSRWCQWELDMANHKMFDDTRSFLILLEREALERASLPRHLKFLMDTRTYLQWRRGAGAEEARTAVKRLEQALGPSLRQRAPARQQGERAPLLLGEAVNLL